MKKYLALFLFLAPSVALANGVLNPPPTVLLGQANTWTGAQTFGTANATSFIGPLTGNASGSAGSVDAAGITGGLVPASHGGAGTLTGLVKGNGASAPTAAVSGTDYAPATSGSSILKASSGGFANAVAGTDYAPATSGTSILKASGGGFANAVSGTDYAPATSGSSILAGNGAGGTTAAYGGKTIPYIFQRSATPLVAPNDTTEDTLLDITIPANTLGANGCFVFRFMATMTGSTNTKTLKEYFSTTGGTMFWTGAVSTGTNIAYSDMVGRWVCNAGVTNSQLMPPLSPFGGAAAAVAVQTAAADTTAATHFIFTIQKALGSENFTMNWYSMEILP